MEGWKSEGIQPFIQGIIGLPRGVWTWKAVPSWLPSSPCPAQPSHSYSNLDLDVFCALCCPGRVIKIELSANKNWISFVQLTLRTRPVVVLLTWMFNICLSIWSILCPFGMRAGLWRCFNHHALPGPPALVPTRGTEKHTGACTCLSYQHVSIGCSSHTQMSINFLTKAFSVLSLQWSEHDLSSWGSKMLFLPHSLLMRLLPSHKEPLKYILGNTGCFEEALYSKDSCLALVYLRPAFRALFQP